MTFLQSWLHQERQHQDGAFHGFLMWHCLAKIGTSFSYRNPYFDADLSTDTKWRFEGQLHRFWILGNSYADHCAVVIIMWTCKCCWVFAHYMRLLKGVYEWPSFSISAGCRWQHGCSRRRRIYRTQGDYPIDTVVLDKLLVWTSALTSQLPWLRRSW